jgi:hypothetical protein
MYWIYLFLFVLVVLTPKIIQVGVLFFHEEDLESLLIFCLGTLGFMLYLAKEKALLKMLKEKLRLQKQTHTITRDLSQSYSYIGEMNRKFDIVKELIFRLPKDTTDTRAKNEPKILYASILEAVRLLTKGEAVSLRFIHLKNKTLEQVVEENAPATFEFFGVEKLLAPKKIFWEEEGCVIVRSPRQAGSVVAFLIFPKVTNHIEDTEIFKILASEALFLYAVKNNLLVENSLPSQ